MPDRFGWNDRVRHFCALNPGWRRNDNLRADSGASERESNERTVEERDGRPDETGDRALIGDEGRPHKPPLGEPERVVRAEETRSELAHGFVGTAGDDLPTEYVIR